MCSCGKAKVTGKCNWNKDSINSLLTHSKENKGEVRKLRSRVKGIKKALWDGACSKLNHQYTFEQIANKWKNIQRENKVNFYFFNKKFDQNYIHLIN